MTERNQMSEVGDQQTKNLEYLRDCLINGTVSIMGCLKQIENHLEFMTKALTTYEKDLDNEHKLPNSENSKVE